MLDQLVESKSNQRENARRGRFLFTTLGIMTAVLASGWTYSLFAKNFAMSGNDFDLSRVVAPVAIGEEPPPKPEIKVEKTSSAPSKQIVLKEIYEDLSRSVTPPKDLGGQKDVVNARQFDLSMVKRGDINAIPETVGRRGDGDSTDKGCGLCEPEKTRRADNEPDEKLPEVVVKPTPKPTPKNLPPQSLGVINGRATYLAKPPYPAAAKAIRLQGEVNVEVLIDETGRVTSAAVVSGHPLLRAAAVQAARECKFTPTLLSSQPVKVTGIIVYKFSL
ncbi:MAG: TonB family protein [Acidobacteria bacterium]|nr:TonB family protein [Acidobacteriota bacterium]